MLHLMWGYDGDSLSPSSVRRYLCCRAHLIWYPLCLESVHATGLCASVSLSTRSFVYCSPRTEVRSFLPHMVPPQRSGSEQYEENKNKPRKSTRSKSHEFYVQ